MKILSMYDWEELEGKTISFVHMAQFADQVTIATTDNEVLMVTTEIDEDSYDKEIRVLGHGQVMDVLNKQKYLREELSKRGIFDLEKFKEQERRRIEENKRKLQEQKERKDKEEYERLKRKFEEEN